MKRLICGILLLLLLTGCVPANRNEDTISPPDTSAGRELPTVAPSSAEVSGCVEDVAEPAPTLAPEPKDGIGVTMELSRNLVATPGAPCVELVISFPKVDLRNEPEGRSCALRVELDGETVGEWPELLLVPGAEQKLPLEFAFDRYTPDRTAKVVATLRCGEQTLEAETGVELNNYPEELYVQLSGDERPYSIDVLRNQNVVIVYGRDADDEYTVPVKVWLCSTGPTTPRGNYLLGGKKDWGLLFGGVYGQYVCGITGDILFHSVPYARKEKDSLKTEEYNKLGTTASMGCVRLAAGNVKWIYDNCPSGTAVHIFDAEELPVERPEAIPLDPEDPRSCWDPTDPDPENPWNQDKY